MLDEAIAVFGRACLHAQFAPEAHFQLGYLAQQHRHDVDSAYEHYEKALGPSYSPHFVRTSRHLAHLDYLTGRYDRALERLQDLVDHDDAIMGFARDLQSASQLGWEDDACIRGLEGALKRHAPLLQRCARLSHVRGQFDNHRRFSATEGFLESYPVLKEELLALRPDARVYYDAARYAIKAGRSSLAVPWLKRCHDGQLTLNGRRAFLIEAMADDDFLMGNVGRFLQNAWAETERIRAANEAAAEIARIAAEKARQRRRIAFALRHCYVSECAISFAFFGGIGLGIFGFYNWIWHNEPYQQGTVVSINLFTGLMYGAMLGGLIGAVTGYIIGWCEFRD